MVDKACIIVGAGPGLGSALARTFAEDGYAVCPARRNQHALDPLVQEIRRSGGRAYPFGLDARDEASVTSLFEAIENDIGEIDIAIFNANGFARTPILETAAEDFRATWENAAYAGFLVGREAAKYMVPRGRGTIIFTGATASVRGGAGFAAFAGGKFALRALAQSMARELAPKGVHVAHSVIDGQIDAPDAHEKTANVEERRKAQSLLDPHAIARAYRNLAQQDRTAWTFELELRPWVENW